jgi:hypothetical protein
MEKSSDMWSAPMSKYRIEVVNLRKCPDFGTRPGDFYIDRRSQWGNMFPLGKYSREESIRLYEEYFKENLIGKISQLATANRLGCWCSPLPCHGDVIKRYLVEYLDRLEVQLTLDGKRLYYYKDPKRK